MGVETRFWPRSRASWLTAFEARDSVHLMSMQSSGTTSGAYFHQEALDLQRRLQSDSSPRARELAVEAGRLVKLFEEWNVVRPDPELKARVVRDLFDLNRAVLEHLGVMSGIRRSAPDLPGLQDDDDD